MIYKRDMNLWKQNKISVKQTKCVYGRISNCEAKRENKSFTENCRHDVSTVARKLLPRLLEPIPEEIDGQIKVKH